MLSSPRPPSSSLGSFVALKMELLALHQITQTEVREAIDLCLHRGQTRGDDVAACLNVSRSTLTRHLNRIGTTFVIERRHVRLEAALTDLFRGRPLSKIAADLCMSTDHLSRLLHDYCGLPPRKILQALRVSKRLAHWKSSGAPRHDSAHYRRSRRAWKRYEAELYELVGDLRLSSPIGRWADAILTDSARPDFRAAAYRKQYRLKERHQATALHQALERSLRASTEPASGGSENPRLVSR